MWKKKDYLVDSFNKEKVVPQKNTSDIPVTLIDEKLSDNIFKKEQKLDNSKLVMAKILKELRERNEHLLLSVFQDFNNVKIVESNLVINFTGENYKEILEKTSNLSLINDIIKKDNLKVEYIFNSLKKECDVIDVLKEKFNKINIKE